MHVTRPIVPVSRRVALARLGAGGLGVALSPRRSSATAQDATPPIAARLPPVLRAFIAAQEARDLDRLLALHAEDAVVEEVPTGVVYAGRDAIRGYFETFYAAFPDATMHYTNAFAAEAWAGAEWTFSGTYTGQLPDLPPGAGQPLTIRGVDIVAFAGDRVRGGRVYYDLYGFLVQLGVLPPPAAATPPA
jgi:steroid delta-isomerase-like uncharacterized protein